MKPGYGEGWLSTPAHDWLAVLCAFVFVGDEEARVLRAVALGGEPGRVTNLRTVERIVQEQAPDALKTKDRI